MGGVIGGAQAIRAREGTKWHRLVDRETAEQYARGHGRHRKSEHDRAAPRMVVLCGQRLKVGFQTTTITVEDRPTEDACGKCWAA